MTSLRRESGGFLPRNPKRVRIRVLAVRRNDATAAVDGEWRAGCVASSAMSDIPFEEPPHRIRVRYCETDRMGVAHHGSYVAWFEEARTEWLRKRGKCYRQMEDEGDLLQIVEFEARYQRPLDFDDEILIRPVGSAQDYARPRALDFRHVEHQFEPSAGGDRDAATHRFERVAGLTIDGDHERLNAVKGQHHQPRIGEVGEP